MNNRESSNPKKTAIFLIATLVIFVVFISSIHLKKPNLYLMGNHVFSFSPDGNYLYTGIRQNPGITMWDLKNTRCFSVIKFTPEELNGGTFYPEYQRLWDVSPDGKSLAISNYITPKIYIWNTSLREFVFEIKANPKFIINKVQFTSDSRYLVANENCTRMKESIENKIVILKTDSYRVENKFSIPTFSYSSSTLKIS